MESINICSEEETVLSTFMKSLMSLSQNSSATKIQLLESNEYCKNAKTNLKMLKLKIESLTEAKTEIIKIKEELEARNKINATNLESLFQTQSELFNYKCEVKADYIMAEENMKQKKLKYNKIITSYKEKWEAAEREYKKLPLAVEYSTLQDENCALHMEETRLEEGFHKIVSDYKDQLKNLKNNLENKTIEFVKEYHIYLKYINLIDEIQNKRDQLQKLEDELKILESTDEIVDYCTDNLKKNTLLFNIQRKIKKNDNEKFEVDLTAFDVMIPLEYLEIENEQDSYLHLKYNEADICVDKNLYFDVESELSHENCESTTSEIHQITQNECSVQNNRLNKNIGLNSAKKECMEEYSQYFPMENSNINHGIYSDDNPHLSSPKTMTEMENSSRFCLTRNLESLPSMCAKSLTINLNENEAAFLKKQKWKFDIESAKKYKDSHESPAKKKKFSTDGTNLNELPPSDIYKNIKSESDFINVFHYEENAKNIPTSDATSTSETTCKKRELEETLDPRKNFNEGLWQKCNEAPKENDKMAENEFSFFLNSMDTNANKSKGKPSVFNLF